MSEANKNADAKITVYWLNNSRAQRILWLLEEVKADYEIKCYKRGKDMLAPPELREIHPLGKSPVIGIQTAESEKPLIVAESAVIVEYLSDHFGTWLIPQRYPPGKEGVLGAETEEWKRYRYIMHYTEGSLMTPLVLALIVMNIRKAPVPFFLKFITGGIANKLDSALVQPELKKNMAFLEEYLTTSPSGGEFFCSSSLSGADIMIAFALEGAVQAVPLEAEYPKLYSFVRRMQARDAYIRAGERATEATGEKFVPMSDVEL